MTTTQNGNDRIVLAMAALGLLGFVAIATGHAELAAVEATGGFADAIEWIIKNRAGLRAITEGITALARAITILF
jgi:hypothetical protein